MLISREDASLLSDQAQLHGWFACTPVQLVEIHNRVFCAMVDKIVCRIETVGIAFGPMNDIVWQDNWASNSPGLVPQDQELRREHTGMPIWGQCARVTERWRIGVEE